MAWRLTSRHSAGRPHSGFPSIWKFLTEGQVPLAAALALNLLWFVVFVWITWLINNGLQ